MAVSTVTGDLTLNGRAYENNARAEAAFIGYFEDVAAGRATFADLRDTLLYATRRIYPTLPAHNAHRAAVAIIRGLTN